MDRQQAEQPTRLMDTRRYESGQMSTKRCDQVPTRVPAGTHGHPLPQIGSPAPGGIAHGPVVTVPGPGTRSAQIFPPGVTTLGVRFHTDRNRRRSHHVESDRPSWREPVGGVPDRERNLGNVLVLPPAPAQPSVLVSLWTTALLRGPAGKLVSGGQ